MTKELESGYYWVMFKYSYHWQIAFWNKFEQAFKCIGEMESVESDWVNEIDETPIKRP